MRREPHPCPRADSWTTRGWRLVFVKLGWPRVRFPPIVRLFSEEGKEWVTLPSLVAFADTGLKERFRPNWDRGLV